MEIVGWSVCRLFFQAPVAAVEIVVHTRLHSKRQNGYHEGKKERGQVSKTGRAIVFLTLFFNWLIAFAVSFLQMKYGVLFR